MAPFKIKTILCYNLKNKNLVMNIFILNLMKSSFKKMSMMMIISQRNFKNQIMIIIKNFIYYNMKFMIKTKILLKKTYFNNNKIIQTVVNKISM